MTEKLEREAYFAPEEFRASEVNIGDSEDVIFLRIRTGNEMFRIYEKILRQSPKSEIIFM